MARPSPGTQRVLSILNLLAKNPGKSFSLTELIDGLKMNRSTCHSLASELVNAGYLYRTHDKLYVLGAAAAELGRAASVLKTPLEIALPEMKALALRHDAICSAVFRDGVDVVIRERALSALHMNSWFGDRQVRWPLRPPFGSIFLAWSSETQVEAWFDSLRPSPSPDERQQTRQGIAFARENHFQFVTHRRPELGFEGPVEWVLDPVVRPLEVSNAIVPTLSYWMTSMSSPVFDQKSNVGFVLSMTGFREQASGQAILALAGELREACKRISMFSQI